MSLAQSGDATLDGIAIHRLVREYLRGRDEALDDIITITEDNAIGEFGVLVSMSNVIMCLSAIIHKITYSNEEYTEENLNKALDVLAQTIVREKNESSDREQGS